MPNPLGGPSGIQNGGGPFGNIANLISQFNQFRNSFTGDPKQEVQNLLNSGRMTQEQFNYLQQQASIFQKILK